jgi:hypothetical protein
LTQQQPERNRSGAGPRSFLGRSGLVRRLARGLALLIVTALGLLSASAEARPLYHGVNYGFGSSYNLRLAQNLGANVIRIIGPWSGLEGAGHPRFSAAQDYNTGSCTRWPACGAALRALDRRVAEAWSLGERVLVQVGWGDTPVPFRMASCPAAAAGACPPHPSDYARFGYNLALRYAERRTPIMIEVWNEPDGAFMYQYPPGPLPRYCAPGTVSRTACEYSRLVTYLKHSLATGDRRVRRTVLAVGALSSTSTSWSTASNWINDMYRNGALAAATALSFHLFPQTSSNTTAVKLAVNVLWKIRNVLHSDGMDSKQVWLDELSRAPNLNNMSDTLADRDFYRRMLPALDQATYRHGSTKIKALQGIFPYQADDDQPRESSCPVTPTTMNVDLWCAAGLYYRNAAFTIKPAGEVVRSYYHVSGTWRRARS